MMGARGYLSVWRRTGSVCRTIGGVPSAAEVVPRQRDLLPQQRVSYANTCNHKLSLNQNHHTFALISPRKIVMCSKIPGTKFINHKRFEMSWGVPSAAEVVPRQRGPLPRQRFRHSHVCVESSTSPLSPQPLIPLQNHFPLSSNSPLSPQPFTSKPFISLLNLSSLS